MEPDEITITYHPVSQIDILRAEPAETVAEIEYIRKESEEIAELRRLVIETTEIAPMLCTTT